MDGVGEFGTATVRLHVLRHAADDMVQGAWLSEELARHGHRIAQSTLYPLLHRMERAALLTSFVEVVGGRRRRSYRATGQRCRVLAEWREALGELAAELLDAGRHPGSRPDAPGPDPSRPDPRSPPASDGTLARRLGLGDAVVLGVGSMVGAGVFAAFGPAAAAAGSGLLLALLLAAVVAYANATSSARLAAIHPESGGTYVYGRRRLGNGWGFLAGWAFVVGKTASCAAMALTLGAYAWPDHARPIAAAAVVVFTAVNYLGVSKTARLTGVLVMLTLAALTAVVTGALTGPTTSPSRLVDWFPHGPLGILEAAGLLFFAFAGYARIATLGEEVNEPARTIPRAIPLALGIVVVVYAVVGASALAAVGPAALASSATPLATAADPGNVALTAVIRGGGAVAAGGVLLSLLAGVGRTTLAMARDHELPHRLAAIHPRYQVPHRAELALGAVVLVLVLLFDLRAAIGFSSFAVLVYYAIANTAALTLEHRRSRAHAIAVLGLVGCLVLAFTLPLASSVTGAAVLLLGLAGRALVIRLRPPHPTPQRGAGPGSRSGADSD